LRALREISESTICFCVFSCTEKKGVQGPRRYDGDTDTASPLLLRSSLRAQREISESRISEVVRQKEALSKEKLSALQQLAEARAERKHTAEVALRLEGELISLREEARGLAARAGAAEERGGKAARVVEELEEQLQSAETQVIGFAFDMVRLGGGG
jgi:methylphosphotriester-DNA--protein-cysteine methyltransferase